MITAEDIIQEAMEVQVKEASKKHDTLLDKLFDFSSFEKGYNRKLDSNTIWYLTQRLMNEMRKSEQAVEERDSVFKKGLRCVEIYGPEAVKTYMSMWKRV